MISKHGLQLGEFLVAKWNTIWINRFHFDDAERRDVVNRHDRPRFVEG